MGSTTFSSILFALLTISIGSGLAEHTLASCDSLRLPLNQFKISEELIRKSGYNADVRPTTSNDTLVTIVAVNYYVRRIDSIDTVDGAMKVNLIFRERWHDSRLAFRNLLNCSHEKEELLKPLVVPESMISEIWTPDLFIPSDLGISRHSLFKPNSYIKIYPDGDVMHSERISATLACPNMVKDDGKMECDLRVESYAFKADEIQLEWKNEPAAIFVSPEVFVPSGHELISVTPGRCDSTSSAGTYSCIQGKFKFSK